VDREARRILRVSWFLCQQMAGWETSHLVLFALFVSRFKRMEEELLVWETTGKFLTKSRCGRFSIGAFFIECLCRLSINCASYIRQLPLDKVQSTRELASMDPFYQGYRAPHMLSKADPANLIRSRRLHALVDPACLFAQATMVPRLAD
jgi:hypothetical protein